MTNLVKVTAKWDGFPGGPGYSNFYWKEDDPTGGWDQGATAAGVAVNTFFNSIMSVFPNSVKIQVRPDAQIVNDTDGKIIDFASAGTYATLSGTGGTAGYSAASGGVVTWRSSGVLRGRRVRGRTFLVPLASGAYEGDGSIVASILTTISGAATAYINTAGARSPYLWARPTAPGATDGTSFPIITATVPDRVAILRSRRA